MSEVIVVTSGKGGVGKTTTTANIGYALARHGFEVLLIDTDIGLRNLDVVMGLENRIVYNLVDVVEGNCRHQQAIIRDKQCDTLSLLPAAQTRDKSAVSPEQMIKLINQLKPDYDYIIIDCPPSLGLITANALTVADTFLVPIQCEYYALEGLSQLINTVRRIKRQYNESIEIEGVLLTMYDGRLNLTQQVVDEVKKFFPRKVFKTVVPRGVRLSEAPSFGMPVIYYDKSCKGSQAYMALAEEIVGKERG